MTKLLAALNLKDVGEITLVSNNVYNYKNVIYHLSIIIHVYKCYVI